MIYTTIPLSGIIFVLCSFYLAIFCFHRYREYRLCPTNNINLNYWKASLFVSIAMMSYGLPSFLMANQVAQSIGTIIAVFSNAIGFGYFFLIPLYNWILPRKLLVVKFMIYFFAWILLVLMIISPPHPNVDDIGIIHWNLGIIGVLAAIEMSLSFISIIFLLSSHYYRLKKLFIANVTTFIATFLFAGLSGSYEYVGDSSIGLLLATVGLYIGISVVLFSVVHSYSLKKKNDHF